MANMTVRNLPDEVHRCVKAIADQRGIRRRPQSGASRCGGVFMIVLDTNVISEPMRSASDETVAAGLNRQQSRTLWAYPNKDKDRINGHDRWPIGLHPRHRA